MYTKKDVFDFVREEGVKFIRLAFCDLNGNQKNISIMPDELERAFDDGISFDASAVHGFGDEVGSDLFLSPVPSTLSILPWRPSQGKVVKMFCFVKTPDGNNFPKDPRYVLSGAVDRAKSLGINVKIGSEYEFYLFKTDENGYPTKIPFDNAGYMDVAPDDKGENIRREICLSLVDMGIYPESSHHEEGPGQNEIDFRYNDPMAAADDAMNFLSVVKTAAQRNGLYADFSPKPLEDKSGNGLHINMSVESDEKSDLSGFFMAGILSHICEITAFLNRTEESYKRLGKMKAPGYVTWSAENRSQLIRIPAAKGTSRRIELRSPDPSANVYLAYALLIHAGIDGIEKRLAPPAPVNVNLYSVGSSFTDTLESVPHSLDEARQIALNSRWLASVLDDVAAFIDR